MFNGQALAEPGERPDLTEQRVRGSRRSVTGRRGASLDDLEVLEEQLEASGIATPQIHVLSRDEAEVHPHRHLHEVEYFMKTDPMPN